jgi:hypothetical protein
MGGSYRWLVLCAGNDARVLLCLRGDEPAGGRDPACDSDKPAAIEQALKTTKNAIPAGWHAGRPQPRTPHFVVGMRDGNPAVIATE